MLKQEPIYLHRIADRVFFIYKLSNRTRMPITLLHAGLAFKKGGNISDKYRRYLDKYGMDLHDCRPDNTYQEFCENLYVSASINAKSTIKLPSKVYEYVKHFWDTTAKHRVRREIVDMVTRRHKWKDGINIDDKLKDDLNKLYDRLKEGIE